MRVRVWLKRFSIAIAAFLVLIAAVSVLVLRSEWARGEVRQLIERQAGNFLDGTLRVGQVTGSLLRGATLSDVAFERGGRTVFSARRVDLTYSAWSLARGGREISRIRLVDPVVEIEETQGRWSAGAWLKPRPPSTTIAAPFVLAHIEVVNGRLLSRVRESTWRLPPELNRINGDLRLRIGGPTELTLTRLSFSTPDNAFQATSATGAFAFANVTQITALRVVTSAGAIEVGGTVGAPAGGRPVSLDVTLDRLDTRRWKLFSPLMDTLALTATGPVKIGGTVETAAIHATLTTSAGDLETDTVIATKPNQLFISGVGTLARFDAESVTADPQWKSAVTGNVTYKVTGTGSPAAWVADVTLAGGPVRAFGMVADALTGTAEYAAGRVTFDSQVKAYGAAGHAVGAITTSPELVIDVTGDHLAGVDPRRLPAEWLFPGLDAQVGAETFSARWSATSWNATARLTTTAVEGGSIAAGTTVQLTSAPTGVTLSAEGDVAHIDARRLGRALKMAGLDDPLFATRLNGHMRVTGRGATWAEMNLVGRGTLVDSDLAGDTNVPTAEVTYSRESHLNIARVTGGITGLDVVKLGAPEAAAGRINGAADLIVEWRDDVDDVAASATARGTLRLTPSTLAHQPVDRGVIAGEWRDGVFNAQTFDVEGRGVVVNARGRIAVTGGVSAASFEAAATDVAALEYWIGRVLHGAATARGEIKGPFGAPRITGSAESPEITGADIGRFSQASATIDFTLPDWDAARTNGPLRAQAAMWTTAGGAITREVVVDGRLDSLTVFRGRADARAGEFLIHGTFAADWSGELTMDVSAAGASRGGDEWQLDPASGRIRITTSRVTATSVRLTNGVQTILVDGALRLDEGEITSGDHLIASAANVDLAAIDRFLGLGAEITGRASATISMDGRASDPHGRISVDGKELSVRGYTIAALAGVVDVGAGAARTDITMTQPDGVALKALGIVPLAAVLSPGSFAAGVPTPDWDLNLVTEPIDLKIFGPVVPKAEGIGGQVIADVRITGAAGRSHLSGTVALADAKFRVPSAGIEFSGVTADIGFRPDLVTVRRFIAKDKHGHPLTITGQLAVDEGQVGVFSINLEADRVSLVDNAIGSIELSALLQLSGDVSHPALTGNIEVVNGRVEIDRLLRILAGDPLALVAESNLPPEGETPVDVRADAARAAAADTPKPASAAFDSRTFFSALSADVRILAPDNLILRGSRIRPSGKESWSLGDLNVTVGGELTATRRAGQEPRVVGDVTTIRGVYSFEGKRFEIQRGGHIRFSGEVPPDPTFDVRGIRRIQGVEARVDVRGRLSDPSLQLGSNLPLDEADILSMIIFNRPVNQLGETQRADLVGAAASLAGGFVTAPLASKLSKALDLDLLELETVTFGQNVSPRIRVGQQIGARLFVQFAQQFGPQSLSELTAEYQLARFLRLEANTAQGPGSRAQRSLLQRTERFGLDLIFFFNY